MGWSLGKVFKVALTVVAAATGQGWVAGMLWASAAMQASNSAKWNKIGDRLGMVAGVVGTLNSNVAADKIAESGWRKDLGGWGEGFKTGAAAAPEAVSQANAATPADSASQLGEGGLAAERGGGAAAKPLADTGGTAGSKPGGILGGMSNSDKLMSAGLLTQGMGSYQSGKAADKANSALERQKQEEAAREEEGRRRVNDYFEQGYAPGVYTRYQPIPLTGLMNRKAPV